METESKYKCFSLFLFSLVFISTIHSQDPEQSVMDINNIISWVRNDGYHDWVINDSFNAAFPEGTAGGIMNEGICWGGKVYDENPVIIRVNGSTYGTGNLAINRLYRVRSDYKNVDLTKDASNFFLIPEREVTNSLISKIYAQYEKDWKEWPGNKGAPYYDSNKNGRYEADSDIPGIPGASQTIWINYNDEQSPTLYGSPPIGLEIQETYWAYGSNENVDIIYRGLMNVIYKYVKIIYKGSNSSNVKSYIDSMYIVQWVDFDIGYSYDDLIGCDTSFNMGYSYNSNDQDIIYSKYLPAPPALGYLFLNGSSFNTGNNFDSAIVNFKWRKGYKFFHPKPLTVFIGFKAGDTWSYPDYTYNGTLEFYQMMKGYFPNYPENRVTFNQFGIEFGGYGTYMNSGDPLNGTGWVDGITDPPGSRGVYMVTGPFHMKLKDTAEVTLALVGGLGSDHLNSISDLRWRAKQSIYLYNVFIRQMTEGSLKIKSFKEEDTLTDYILHQNYPNPFNSSTIIEFVLRNDAHVKLSVYDILGREVAILVNEEKTAGTYEVKFNADNLASGIYFYRIFFNNSDNKLVYDKLNKSKKIVIIK